MEAFASIIFFICAATLSFSLLLISVYRKSLDNGRKIILFFLLLLVFLTSVVGCFRSYFFINPDFIKDEMALSFLLSLYSLGHSSIPLLMNLYIWFVTGQWFKKRKKSFWFFWAFWLLPILVNDILILSNPWTHVVLSMGEDHTITYGFGMIVSIFNGTFYGVMALVYATIYHKALKRGECLTLFIMVILNTALNIMEKTIFHHLDVDTFFLSLLSAMLLIFGEDINPEIDPVTMLENHDAFDDVMKSSLASKVRLRIIILKISNFDNLRKLFSDTTLDRLEKDLSEDLVNLSYPKCRFFHYRRGVFIINSYDSSKKDNRKLLEDVSRLFSSDRIYENTEMPLKVEAIYLHVPRCTSSLEDIHKIIDYHIINPFDKVSLMEDDVIKTVLRSYHVAKAIQRGIREHSFEVYYQPIYDLKNHCIQTAEALLRLKDEELGNITPDEFIPVAEETGDIIQIGQLVFLQVCNDIEKYHLRSYGLKYVSVNLSRRQFLQTDLSERFASFMKEHQVTSNDIAIEITESTFADKNPKTMDEIRKLQALGFAFLMDDFGTGYSNLEAINGPVNFQIIKIDKSLLWGSEKSKVGEILLKNNMDMILKLGLVPLCEGVENEKQIKLLQDMGCRYLQGFFFSKPVPIDEFVGYLEKTKKEGAFATKDDMAL